jgi:recombinational DNA repair protein RecT
MAEETKTQNQLATLDQKIAAVKNAKELFNLPEVRDRFIRNYEAVTGRKDGENRLEQERFAYLQLMVDKPDLAKVDNFYHFSALVYAGTTGLSFRDNKLYVIPAGRGLKVQSSPAGKREMFCMMPNIIEAPEAVLVMMGDHFIHDKLNNVVKEHYGTEETKENISMETIRAVYQRLKYKDGSIKDVVVYQDELLKAMNKSRTTDKGVWKEWPGEMSKKTATNRAFRLYHRYPDNVVVYGDHDEEEDTKNVSYTVDEPTPPANVDTETGEEIKSEHTKHTMAQEAQIVSQPKPEKEKKQYNLLDE